ncbi:methyl-accepting chemotaxis protein [uncultured Kushneria sp.]|uniref:methyl-accepting chemotaxis protein n=1 Tax=uncultured Kushneria sp. TaxID=905033 RepID=UPI00262F9086|nr:methyl-accepting chemotaxis protein [uncultured Kushneria sp.]
MAMSAGVSTLTNMRVRTCMMLGFSAVLFLIVLLTTIGIWRVGEIDSGLAHINDVNSVKQRHAIDYRGSVHDRAIALRDATLVSDSELPQVTALIDKLTADYRTAAANMTAMAADDAQFTAEDHRLLANIDAVHDRTMPLIERVLETRRSGDIEGARSLLLSQARPAFVDWLASINAFIDYQGTMNHADAGLVRGISGGFKTTMIILCTLAVLLGIVIATLITRGLLKTLGAEPADVRALAEAVGRGELDASRPVYHEKDRSIMAALSRTADRLQETVANVRRTAHEVAHASGHIEQGNSQLSSRTEQQASALEQTAAAMKELSATVRLNADNARDAEQLATRASGVAEQGGQVFGEVVTTMKGINDGARRMSEIISVIDNIAFQTNILALNASVEAARAGEQGRGFAVVANEVRSLASRSAEAAREINALITASVAQTEQGAVLVDRAGQTIEEVVTSIGRVHHIMGDISRASAEQSTGVSQVGEAIGQLDQTTQHNALMVEQNGEASRRLYQQSQALVEAVSVFRLPPSATSTPVAAEQKRASAVTTRPTPAPVPTSRTAKKPDTSGRERPRPDASHVPSRAAEVEEWESF